MKMLKQSTAGYILLGPFLDATDGVTEESGLAGSMAVKVSKAGAAQASRNSATSIAYDALGYYRVHLDATDTATLGLLRVLAHASGTHLPVWEDFMVVPAMVYDSLVLGTDYLDAQMRGIDDGVITAAKLASNAISAAKVASDVLTAIANEVEAQIIDDTDSEKVLLAITDKIASVNPSLSGLTLSAIAAQVRTELTTELGRIDAAITTRLASASYTAPDNTNIANIAARLGAFTGSGVNTVLGFFKALFKKDASNPSDVGGTFDAATDSVEALRDNRQAWAQATINFDDTAGVDEYTIRFMLDSGPTTPTSPTMTVIERSGATTIIDAQSLSAVSGTNSWYYNASGGERLDAGETAIIRLTATVNGVSITREITFKRDNRS
jgi:hypothetical protein